MTNTSTEVMFLIRMFGSTGAGGIVPNVTQPVYFFPMRQSLIVLNSEENQWVEGPCIWARTVHLRVAVRQRGLDAVTEVQYT